MSRFGLAVFAALTIAPSLSLAAVQGSPDINLKKGDQPSHFELGLGGGSFDSAYRNYDEDAALFPIIIYDSAYVYVEAAQAGFKAFENRQHRISLFVEASEEQWDDSDSDAFPEFDERERSINFGLGYRFRSPWGIIKAKAATDIGSDHEGIYGRLSYSYPWHISDDLTILPGVFVKFMDSDYTEYYYGITGSEAAKVAGVDSYDPGSANKYGLQLIGSYQFNGKWRVLAGAKYSKLESDLEDSPMLNDDKEILSFIGVAYKFW